MLGQTRYAGFPAGFADFDRLFNEAFYGNRGSCSTRGVFPAVNAWEDSDNIVVEAELPGFTLDDVEVTMLGRELTVSGTRPDTRQEGAIVHRAERPAQQGAKFSRTLRLGVPIDSARVSARMTHGVLTLTLPKAAEAKPRKIAVSST